jgi:hypothetical protein
MARQHTFEVLLHTDLNTASRYFFADFGWFEQTGQHVMLRGQTDHLDWCAGHLASMPFAFEVRTPEALRLSVTRLGERLLRGGAASL